MAIVVLSRRLQRNQTAAHFDEIPQRMVHHRPPKKIEPSITPASTARMNAGASIISFLLGHPTPGVGAADHQSSYQRHERPGMPVRMAPIPPAAEHGTQNRRHRHGPSDSSNHAKAGP